MGNQRGRLHGPPWQDRGRGGENCSVSQHRYPKNTQLDRLARKDPPQAILFDRKLHDLIPAAIAENWAVMWSQRTHGCDFGANHCERHGVGEFPLGDATLAARLVNTACFRFSHPRLIVEYEEEPEPTLDQMIGFCLMALTRQPV